MIKTGLEFKKKTDKPENFTKTIELNGSYSAKVESIKKSSHNPKTVVFKVDIGDVYLLVEDIVNITPEVKKGYITEYRIKGSLNIKNKDMEISRAYPVDTNITF